MTRLWQISGARSPEQQAPPPPPPGPPPAGPGPSLPPSSRRSAPSAPAFVDGLIDPSERHAERYRSRPAKPWQLALARTGLWTTVVLGCLTGAVALVRSSADDPAPIATDTGVDLPAPVGNVAELAVTSWLTATDDENHMDEFFVDPPRLASMATSNLRVGDVRAVAGQGLGDGYWTVTVAARVTDVSPEPPAEAEAVVDDEDEPVAQTWYVEVGIVGEVAHGLAAVATPAIMPAPSPVSDEWRRSGDAATTPEAGDPVVEAVQGFLEAVLTGSGDPSRYTAPGLDVEALDPAPFADVRVVEMALEDLDAGEVGAWVQAQVTTESGAHQIVGYEFVAVPRVDRWEIVEFWGSPSEIEGPEPAAPPEATDDTSSDGGPSDGGGDGTSSDDTPGTTASGEGSDTTSPGTTPPDTPGTTGPDTTAADARELTPEEMPDEGDPPVSA